MARPAKPTAPPRRGTESERAQAATAAEVRQRAVNAAADAMTLIEDRLQEPKLKTTELTSLASAVDRLSKLGSFNHGKGPEGGAGGAPLSREELIERLKLDLAATTPEELDDILGALSVSRAHSASAGPLEPERTADAEAPH